MEGLVRRVADFDLLGLDAGEWTDRLALGAEPVEWLLRREVVAEDEAVAERRRRRESPGPTGLEGATRPF